MKDRVLNEINVMMREAGEKEESTHNERFRYWRPAAGRILLTLSADELSTIDRIIQTGNEPIPKDIQQQ